MTPEIAVHADTELRKRRSTRVVQAIPLTVTGVDALGRPFTERTSSLVINCHGCRYQSKHYVLKNMWVTLEIPLTEAGPAARTVRGRVTWIQRPRTVRQLFQVALELEDPGNVWGIGFPPEDWKTYAEAENAPASGAGAERGPSNGAALDTAPERQDGQADAPLRGQIPAAEGRFPVPLAEMDAGPATETGNVRIFPSPASATDASLQLARQMARLLGGAQQQIQAMVREATAQTVAVERRADALQWDLQTAAATAAVSQELSRAILQIQNEADQRSRDAHVAAAEALQRDLPRWLSPQLEQLTREMTAQLSRHADAQREEHARQAAAAAFALLTAGQQADEAVARMRASAEQAEVQFAARAEAQARTVEEAIQRQAASLKTQQESLQAAAGEIQQAVTLALGATLAAAQTQLDTDLETGRLRCELAVDNTLAGAEGRAQGTLHAQTQTLLAALRQEAEQLTSAIRNWAEQVAREAERSAASRAESARLQTERMDAALAQASAVTERLEHFSESLGTVQPGAMAGVRGQLEDVLHVYRNELQGRSESLFAEIDARIRAAFVDSGREAAARFEQQIEAIVQLRISAAEETLQRISGGRALLDTPLSVQQERVPASAEEAFAEALARFRGNLAGVEQLLQESATTVTARSLSELESKAGGVKHDAIEDLRKSTEWYEKKAQTQVHTMAERVSELMANHLREKAAEASSAFASELDRSSRSFVGHTQTQLEEVVRDAFERTRGLLAQAMETTSAAFADEMQRNARHALGGFEQDLQKSASETRVQLAAQAELAQKANAEQDRFLERFQADMNGAMESGIAEAQRRMQAGFTPLLESWMSMTEAHQAEMRTACGQISDQAAEQHRARLENVSTQWTLAAGASLDHQSREAVANFAASAEAKLRETCAAVFAGIGDALRERLQEIAAALEMPTPPKT